MFVEVVSNNLIILKCDQSNVEQKLQEKYKDKYYDIYDYSILVINGISIIKLKDDVKYKMPSFNGSTSDKLSSIIDYMNKFKYCKDQPNPNIISRDGGNCQAFSILFKHVCLANNIECSITGTKTHAYNLVKLDKSLYKIDLVNKTMELIK